jgi:hypothetical protein
MQFDARLLRRIALAVAAFPATAIGGQFCVALAEERGVFTNPTAKVLAVTAWLEAVVASAPFHWGAGIAFGFAAGVYLDAIVRRRDAAQPNTVAAPLPEVASTATSPQRPMTEPLPVPPAPTSVGPMTEKPPGLLGSAEHAQAFLKPRPGETEARPFITVTATKNDIVVPTGGRRVSAAIFVQNVTASRLPACRIMIDSYQRGGSAIVAVSEALSVGMADTFPLEAGKTKGAYIVSRNYNVAPDEPVVFNLYSANALRPMTRVTLEDNYAYFINVTIETGAGNVTRAVIELIVSEYERMKVTLLGQASWRQRRLGTEA